MRATLQALFVAAALSGTLSAVPARADDSSDIQSTISAQLQAFRVEDGAAAYSYAAPNIKTYFPSADIFMSMVKQGYAPVYKSSSATFGALKPEGSGFRQEVFLSDMDGQSWIASYTLERQADGSMKITGCQIRKGDDVSA